MNDKDTVVVPREPTPEMIWAYQECPYEGAEDKWSAMLAAAPSTSVREEVGALVTRLRAYRPGDEWGEGVRHTICDEAADALEDRAALKPSTDKGGVEEDHIPDARKMVDLRSDEISAFVDRGFATVSRNPSDAEEAAAYRTAIAFALGLTPTDLPPLQDTGERDGR